MISNIFDILPFVIRNCKTQIIFLKKKNNQVLFAAHYFSRKNGNSKE